MILVDLHPIQGQLALALNQGAKSETAASWDHQHQEDVDLRPNQDQSEPDPSPEAKWEILGTSGDRQV